MTQLYDSYVRWHRLNGHSMATIKDYEGKILNMFISKGIGDIDLKDLTEDKVINYILDIRDMEHLAENTVASYIKSIRAFLNYSYDQGFTGINWLKVLPSYSQYKVKKEIFTDDEVMAIFASIKGDKTMPWLKRLLFAIALDAAPRKGELLRIRVGDIKNVGHPHIVLRGKKTGSDRIVPISYPTYQMYVMYMSKRFESDSDKLFINRYHNPLGPKSIDRYIDTHVKAIGISRGNAHYFRHTRITRWLMEGNSTMVTMIWSGHTKTESLNRYFHDSQELQFAGVNFTKTSLLLGLVPLPGKMRISRGVKIG